MRIRQSSLTASCFVLITAFNSACVGEDDQVTPLSSGRALIIGREFGECSGDCAQLFLILDGEVYPDDGVERTYLTPEVEDWEFSNVPLLMPDALLVDSLIAMLPKELADLPASAFGAPDASDLGSLPLVVVDSAGSYDRYTLDNVEENMDERLRPYARLMQRATREWSR